MSECTHDCSSCESKCAEATDFTERPNKRSHIKRAIGIVSGKGGVGKSLVTSLLAAAAQKKGHKAAILDADITGPSIPKAFGLHERIEADDDGMLPALSKNGTKVVSLNLMLDDETAPVVWRGPVIAGVVKQFWTECSWGDVDFMFIDMPPGTGDVPLTVMQTIKLDGIIIVTTPQDLVTMIVEKAVNMARLMNIPVLGLVENMSYMQCPDCGKKLYPFGEGKVEETAKKYGVGLTAQIAIDPNLTAACDGGKIEDYETDCLDRIMDLLQLIPGADK